MNLPEPVTLVGRCNSPQGKLHIKHRRSSCPWLRKLLVNRRYEAHRAVIKRRELYWVSDNLTTVKKVPMRRVCQNCISDVFDYRYVFEFKDPIGINRKQRYRLYEDALNRAQDMLDRPRYIPLQIIHESDRKKKLWCNVDYFRWDD